MDWADLTRRIDVILEVHGASNLVWRGVEDASWGLYSSLYRRLKRSKPAVEEADLLREEIEIVRRARAEWRLDAMSALEIMAHVQHYGGPTRLLDVTLNPLIATWFAVEQKFADDGTPKPDVDSRVFCFYVGEYIELSSEWGGRDIPWAKWQKSKDRKSVDWGTGKVRRVWRPPAYNARISAQNAGFLLDGVPFGFNGSNTFRKAPGAGESRWRIGEVRDASSIPIKLNQPERAPQTEQSTPAFSFRIAGTARAEIRKRLEDNYGYSTGSLYADMYGLAQNVAAHLPR